MKRRISTAAPLIVLTALTACQKPEPTPAPQAQRTPKTFYGEVIGRTKGLSQQMKARDEQIQQQAAKE